jgi:benzil reductase ((S)-benzoin forming)
MHYFIITGASKGLGEGLAIELLDENHHLLCIARSESDTLKRMAAAKNCPVDFFQFDLAVTRDIPALCRQVFEKVDTTEAEGIYLVNNAGVLRPIGRVETCPVTEVEHHMQVNLLAPMLLTAEFIRYTHKLPARKRVMNISSGAATNPYHGWSSYCTGKAGMDMFTRCVGTEQSDQDHPVECMGVAPGIIDTSMQETIRSATDEQFIHRKKFVEYKEKGQLIHAAIAGKRLAHLLLSDTEFKAGEITDIRDTY